jgi:hypothetical protein
LFAGLSLPAGQGTDEDIVVSSARAYVAALNKLVAWKAKQQPQQAQEDAPAQPAPVPSTDAAAAAGRGKKKAAKSDKGAGRLVTV